MKKQHKNAQLGEIDCLARHGFHFSKPQAVSGTNIVSAFLLLLSNVFTSLALGVTAQKRQGRVFNQYVSLGGLGVVAVLP